VRNELVAGVGAVSDKGIRPENQDRMSRTEAPLGELLIVADGVGGNLGGGTAAGLTIDAVETSMRNAGEQLDPQAALRAAIEAANRAVYEPAHSGDPDLHKMASTVVVVLVRNETAYIAHVGDSRAYLVRGNELRRLTVDHSRIQQMLDAKQLTPEQARDHPDQGVLTRAIGDKPEVRVDDAQPVRLQEGDGLLLCSDGLHGYVEDKVILDTIRSAKSPQQASEKLLSLALKNGSRDNVTVQYARFQAPHAVRGGEISGGRRGEKRRRWGAIAAAALAVGFGAYFLYPRLPWGRSGQQLQQQYDAAVSNVASLQAESDSAATDAAAYGKAVESLQHAADEAGDMQQKQAVATAALSQANQTANDAHKTVDSLNSQIASVTATIATLNAKDARTDQEEQNLASAKTQKQGLDGELRTAKDAAAQADRQVSTRQRDLNKANQALARISSLPESGGRGPDEIMRAFNDAKARQTQAAARMHTAAANLESAKRRRDDLARQLGHASGSGGNSPQSANPPAVQVLILAPKADDPLADALRDYLQAHPVNGAAIEIAGAKALGTADGSGGSATVFYFPSGQQERDRAVSAAGGQVESALREFLAQNRQPGAKVSLVIVSSVN
jgi:protein phosphatase